MNKYRQSLDNISSINLDRVLEKLGYEEADRISVYGMCDYPNIEMTGDIANLLELVNKATPNKPHLQGDGYDLSGNIVLDTWVCPNCEEHYEVGYDDYDYCPKCGQALDLSEIREAQYED